MTTRSGLFFIFLVAITAHAQVSVNVVYPAEGTKLPFMPQTFMYGATTPGAELRVNGSTVPVHAMGGFLVNVPIQAGENIVTIEATLKNSTDTAKVEHRFIVANPWVPIPPTPTRIERWSMEPKDDVWLQPGDTFRVAFTGSSQGLAEFRIGNQKHIPMGEVGGMRVVGSTFTIGGKGIYEGLFTIPESWDNDDHSIEVTLHQGSHHVREKLKAKLKVLESNRIRMGMITDEITAVRAAPDGGYDFFVYRGMKVRLIGKIGSQWKIRVASNQVGWVKESALQEMTPGMVPPRSVLANMTVSHQDDSSIVKIPLSDMLPFRVEQTNDPMMLSVTVYGAINRTDLVRYDVQDPLIDLVRWKQIAPDVCQIQISPTFKRWWGADVRYEGNQLIIEIRKPWMTKSIKNLPIAVDAGHGGTDAGAMGPRRLLEKDANLLLAKQVVETLNRAGAKAFLTRETDTEVSLTERTKLAFRKGGKLFISMHCNASPANGNPLETNGFSLYWYQPQSLPLAKAIHRQYAKFLGLKDQGLFFADFAVCRPPHMPAILTENAYIIVPEQEALLFSPVFHKKVANAILTGVREFLK